MCTNGVWQMTSLQFRYCNIGGSSVGARSFIRENLVDFAVKNPQIDIKTKLVRGKHPAMVAGYLKGVARQVDLRNKTPKQIEDQLFYLRNCKGQKVGKFKQPVISKLPSIQGSWVNNDKVKSKIEIKAIEVI